MKIRDYILLVCVLTIAITGSIGWVEYFKKILTQKPVVVEETVSNDITIFEEATKKVYDTIEQVNLNTTAIYLQNKKLEKPTYEDLKSYAVLICRYQEKEIDEKLQVVRVARGSGSVIKITDDYTYVLTNKHVCDSTAERCSVYDENDDEYFMEFVKESPTKDLAIWKYLGKIEGKKQIKGVGKVEVQDKVFFVGNYLGFGYIYGEGVVAGRSRHNDLFLQLPGMRGG